MGQSAANLVDMRDVSFSVANAAFSIIFPDGAAREDHGDHGAVGHR